MSQGIIKNQYGVNVYLSKFYLNRINEKADKSQYQYTVEIIEGDSYNGNGYCTMKIYKNGNLQELTSGGWRVSPIVKMTYNWGGYYDKIDVVDTYGEFYTIDLGQPDSTSLFKKGDDFRKDVEAVLEKIFSLKDFLNVTHLRMEEQICEINKIIRLYDSSYPSHINEYIDEAKSLCLKLKDYISKDSKFQELYNIYSSKIIEIERILVDKYKKRDEE